MRESRILNSKSDFLSSFSDELSSFLGRLSYRRSSDSFLLWSISGFFFAQISRDSYGLSLKPGSN
jgi:hypothetical protein